MGLEVNCSVLLLCLLLIQTSGRLFRQTFSDYANVLAKRISDLKNDLNFATALQSGVVSLRVLEKVDRLGRINSALSHLNCVDSFWH